MSKLKAFFLDRDGVINLDNGYIYKKEDFVFNEKLFNVLIYLKNKGFYFFIITNQSGIGRGFYTHNDFIKLNKWMINKFKFYGIRILSVEYCPHVSEDNCNCRKPKTGMLEKIKKKHNLDLKNSWMVGDKESDILFAKSGGINNTIFLNNNNYGLKFVKPDFIINSLDEIKKII